MKTYIGTAILILATLLSFTSCRDNDDDITPSGDYSPIRGGFPQGTTELDSIIYDIKQDYGVYLLYKDVTEEDMNRTWITAGTDNIYIAGDSTEREVGSWTLPDNHLPYYVDFFRNYILPNISKEFANRTFPIKIYMIDHLRTEPRDYGEENKVDENNSGNTEEDPNKIIKLGEFDNWAISFPDSIIDALSQGDKAKTDYILKQMRCVFMVNVIKNSIEKGDIVAPKGFWDKYEFKKSKTCTTDKDHSKCTMVEVTDKNAENHLYKFGYVDVLEEKFGTGRSPEIIKDVTLDKEEEGVQQFQHSENWTKIVNPTWDMFEAYIMNAMWFTPEEWEERYDLGTNTIIKEQYELVVNHLKEQYGVDLVGIANGNKEEQPNE